MDKIEYLTEKLLDRVDADLDELQKRLDEAFRNDKSHTRRLAENE